MVVLAPPYPGPPLFMALKSAVPLSFGTHQGTQCVGKKSQKKHALTVVRIHRLVNFQFLLLR